MEIRDECTGCMACMNVCSHQAIHPTVNAYGFIMPEIDRKRCIGCGQCENVCPILDREEKKDYKKELSGCKGEEERQLPLKAYSMVHHSADVVRMSSSGGAFYALASAVLKEKGIVFGCYYDVKRKKARLADTDHVDLEDLLTSKYVESYIGYGFLRIKKQLDAGRKVLFCGTPCQAAGLARFLKKSYENLLIVDFTCGAVSAQTCLRDYLVRLERKYRSKIKEMSFRDKHYGWGQYCFFLQFESGRIYRKTAMSDPYFFCFLRSSMQRLSCHGCRFSDRHSSDVVLSDFWKCDDFAVERNERRGISLALAMTEKGRRALEEAGAQMHVDELDIGEASYNLTPRVCPEGKLPEIYAHQAWAFRDGVEVLRKRLLSPKQRMYFAFRQQVMDHPRLARRLPGVVGNGQMMKKGK